MFLFKRKKIVVDAFTRIPGVYDFAPIKPASDFIPAWWKKLPVEYDSMMASGIKVKNSTMKRCRGFVDLYTKGFIIPLWSDLVIETNSAGGWRSQWSDPGMTAQGINSHSPEQFGGFAGEIHLKVNSPWLAQEKTGVEFIWMDPIWNKVATQQRVKILPGVLNFKHQHSLNINLLAWSRDDRILMTHGSPMAHVVPLSDNDVIVKNHLIEENEYMRIHARTGFPFKFANLYNARKKIVDEDGTAKCPFHSLIGK